MLQLKAQANEPAAKMPSHQIDPLEPEHVTEAAEGEQEGAHGE